MKKKKVLILGKLPPPYIGPAIATKILLESSLKQSFELIHLDTRVNEELSAFGKISARKILKNLALYAKMRRLIRLQKPDLVLVPISQTLTGFLKDSVFIDIAARNNIKCIVHLRGSEFRKFYDKGRNIARRKINSTLSKCEGAIVLGENLKGIFRDLFPQENIFVVPNGGNYLFPQKNTGDKIKVLYFSNLLASKGVMDVIKAADKLSGAVELDLVGAWQRKEDKTECEQILKNKPLPVKIHPPCSGEKKWQFFADADIFIFPPRGPEGHPWCIVEAMAAGLPVIATDKGAITESVIDHGNGFIVDAAKPDQLAEKICLLAKDASLRRKMGEESRRLYLEKFTEEKMVQRLKDVFNSVIDGK